MQSADAPPRCHRCSGCSSDAKPFFKMQDAFCCFDAIDVADVALLSMHSQLDASSDASLMSLMLLMWRCCNS